MTLSERCCQSRPRPLDDSIPVVPSGPPICLSRSLWDRSPQQTVHTYSQFTISCLNPHALLLLFFSSLSHSRTSSERCLQLLSCFLTSQPLLSPFQPTLFLHQFLRSLLPKTSSHFHEPNQPLLLFNPHCSLSPASTPFSVPLKYTFFKNFLLRDNLPSLKYTNPTCTA